MTATKHLEFRLLFFVMTVFPVMTGSGCHGLPWKQSRGPQIPKILADNAQINDVITAVNARNSQIRSFVTNTARIQLSNSPIPISNCRLAYERQRKLRARGDVAISGPVFDIGSNEDLFWFWSKTGQGNGIYYCRHDQFANSSARDSIPMDLDWLIESMGIVDFKLDGTEQHELLIRGVNDPYVIQTIRPTPRGTYRKMTTIHKDTGCVLSQALYGPGNRLVATADSPNHTIDPTSNIVYPKSVSMTFVSPNETLQLQLDLGTVQFNISNSFNQDTFTMPTYVGYTPVNICDPAFNGVSQVTPVGVGRQ